MPQVYERLTDLRFERKSFVLPGLLTQVLALVPIPLSQPMAWLALTAESCLVRFSLQEGEVRAEALVQTVALPAKPLLVVSPDGRFAAVAASHGQFGQVWDLAQNHLTMSLDRGNYHEDVSLYSLAFFMEGDRPLLAHASRWNRLDISDPATGECLSSRTTLQKKHWSDEVPHYLDYFHAGLTVSPASEWILDDGWCWHPLGRPRVWNLHEWLTRNSWESEDGESVKTLRSVAYFWDSAKCWISESVIALWGYGDDADRMLPAVQFFDVQSGKLLGWFGGPDVTPPDVFKDRAQQGWMTFDKWLFAISPENGTASGISRPGSGCIMMPR